MRLILWWLCLVAATTLTAADWDKKPFPDWRQSVVERLLTESPWTRPRTIRLEWESKEDRLADYRKIPHADHQWNTNTGGSPVGGIGPGKQHRPPDRADILIRWASALPVRQAAALYKQREDKLDSVSINQLLTPASPDYVVELYGVPSEVAHRGASSLEAIAQGSATLTLQTGRVLKPNRVEARVHADTVEIRVHFPRTEPIEVADREVEFFVDMQLFSVKEKFRLYPMLYQGNLEL